MKRIVGTSHKSFLEHLGIEMLPLPDTRPAVGIADMERPSTYIRANQIKPYMVDASVTQCIKVDGGIASILPAMSVWTDKDLDGGVA